MNTFIKNKKGFTLVEVIISIAVLGIVSGVVLKLFVLSNDLSNKVGTEDLASAYASNAIEICKASDSPKQAFKAPFFNEGDIVSDNGQEKCVLYYDDSFNNISTEGKLKLTIIIKSISDNLSLPLSISDNNNAKINSGLYNIQVTVEEKNESSYKTIISYATDKYYVFKE